MCPTITHPDVVAKIVHLRQHYHFGPLKIADVPQALSRRGYQRVRVWRILTRLDERCRPLNATSSRAVETLREAASWPSVQSTSSSSSPSPPDQASQALLPIHRDRRLHPAPRSPRLSPLRPEDRDPVPRLRAVTTALQVEKIQTDNGAEFQSRFHWHLLDHGIGHIYIRPATPRLNGKWSDHTASTPRVLPSTRRRRRTRRPVQQNSQWSYYNYHRPTSSPTLQLLQKHQLTPTS